MYTSSQKSWTTIPFADVSVPGLKRSMRVATPPLLSRARIRSYRPGTLPATGIHSMLLAGKNSSSGLLMRPSPPFHSSRAAAVRIWIATWVSQSRKGIIVVTLAAEPQANIPLLAVEGWRDSLIEAGAPGAKREPDRAKRQLVVSSAGLFPHLPCRIHDQLQFPPLSIFRKKVPGSYGSKSALRTEREIFQGN